MSHKAYKLNFTFEGDHHEGGTLLTKVRVILNERIKKSTHDTFASTVKGYTTVLPEASNIQLQNGKAKYALYPVWLLNTTWNGKQYTFAMNGQTGKLVGDLPMDKAAYWKWLLGLTGAVGAAAFALQTLLWFL